MPKPSKRGLSAPMGHLGDTTVRCLVADCGLRINPVIATEFRGILRKAG